MLAAMAVTDQDAVPPELAEELERRIAEMRSELPRIIFDHTELLIWLRLYGDVPLELGELGLTLP